MSSSKSIFGDPVGTNPASDAVVVIIWLAFGIALPLYFYFTKLVTDVEPMASTPAFSLYGLAPFR